MGNVEMCWQEGLVDRRGVYMGRKGVWGLYHLSFFGMEMDDLDEVRDDVDGMKLWNPGVALISI